MEMKPKKAIFGVIIFLVLSIVGYFGLKLYVEHRVKQSLDEEIKHLSSLVDIEYGKLRVDMFRQRLHVSDVDLSSRYWKDPIKIDEVVASGKRDKDNGYSDVQFDIADIQLLPGGPLGVYVKKMGYPEIRANVECGYAYDRKNRTLTLKRLKVKAPNMGEAELRFHLQNIDLAAASAVPTNILVLLAKLSNIKIAEAEIYYHDDSLMQKIYETAAAMLHQPVEAFRNDMTDRIDRLIVEYKDTPLKESLTAIRKFAASPRSIKIMIKPQKPLPLNRLYFIRQSEQLVELLGVQVEI